MGVCVPSFPLKLGVGEEGNHPSHGKEIYLSGLGEGALKAWHELQARGELKLARRREREKCAFFDERGRSHGCTYKSIERKEGVPKGREWQG